ncbi:MAG: polyphosphate kinase 1 [Clostridia bacterium]|nr:polyphosphate kinase 1 [Clostridia bacterium]
MGKQALYNRELSWLNFNRRVLEEAANPDNPLLERGKFLSICSTNLDEFFMVRVGALVRAASGGDKKKDPSGLSPRQQLDLVFPAVREQVERQYELLNGEYLPALAEAGIHFLKMDKLDKEQKEWVSHYFDEQIQPLLTPRAIDEKRPFPLLTAKRLHLFLLLPPQPGLRAGSPRMAMIAVPASLPRVVMLPMGRGRARGILLEDVIAFYAHRLFSKTHPMAVLPFRIIRNTDFLYNDSDADALIREMRKNLKRRKWGRVVRLEVPTGGDVRLISRLKKYLIVSEENVFFLPGPINLDYFMKQISQLPEMDDLLFPPFTPRVDERLRQEGSIFRVIRDGDLLLNHPYDSFEPVIRFIREAAEDPNVMAIKQTLYRVSGKSPIVGALIRAGQAGKQVTVLVEVRARFDEENNINWCQALEKAGCHVFYGVPKLKTHSKITLVVRKEASGLRRYVHLATGNYNDVTATLYTDMGLFTCDDAIGRDAGNFFNMVTGYSEPTEMEKLVAAPTHLRDFLSSLIRREIEHAQAGLPAQITAKINALVDPKMIKLLYEAADAGVEIDLIVRGICCLKPNGRGNIRVRSIVGRFLEHTRAFIFENGGEKEVYLSSADWMPRNLDKRVELMFPVEDPALQNRVIASLQDELMDNAKAWRLKKNGEYKRVKRTEPPINSQEMRILGPAEIASPVE